MRASASIMGLMCLAMGCNSNNTTNNENNAGDGGSGDSIQLPAYVDLGARWPSRSIPVCWNNSSAETKSLQEMVSNYVSSEFAQASIKFTWSDCASLGNGITAIRIQIVTTGTDRPWSYIGPVNSTTTMLLNFSNERCNPSNTNRDSCILGDSLHEFGHAVGLRHEQDRPDSLCEEEPRRDGKGTLVGKYDPSSIMNYCHDYFRPSARPVLSSGDMAGITHVYGLLAAGSVPDWGYADRRWMVDFNGDGKTDLCRATGLLAGRESYFRCMISGGNSLSGDLLFPSIEWGDDRRWMADFDGDRKIDYCRGGGIIENATIWCSLWGKW